MSGMRLYMEDVRWKDALNADLKTQSNGGMTDTSAEIVAVNSKAAEKKAPRGYERLLCGVFFIPGSCCKNAGAILAE